MCASWRVLFSRRIVLWVASPSPPSTLLRRVLSLLVPSAFTPLIAPRWPRHSSLHAPTCFYFPGTRVDRHLLRQSWHTFSMSPPPFTNITAYNHRLGFFYIFVFVFPFSPVCVLNSHISPLFPLLLRVQTCSDFHRYVLLLSFNNLIDETSLWKIHCFIIALVLSFQRPATVSSPLPVT